MTIEEKIESNIMGLTTIVGCLKKAEEITGKDTVWNAKNEIQKRFLTKYPDLKDLVLNLKEVEAEASYDVNVVNKFLKNQGFDIQLNPLSNPQSFAVASTLDLLVKWVKEGAKTHLEGKMDMIMKL